MVVALELVRKRSDNHHFSSLKGGKFMSKLDYEISEKYSHELGEIQDKLNQLEGGRVYELSRAQMDGYLATNVQQLRTMLNDLLNKLQNGEQSTSERIGEFLEKVDI